MNTIYNKSIILLVAFFCATAAYSQYYSESMDLSRSFKLNPTTSVDINNKYGKIHFVHWDNDSVRFDISMTIKSSYPTRLAKLKESINFDFTATQYYISAITLIGGPHQDIVNDIIDMADPTSSTKAMIDINYTVYLPEYVNLLVVNKYGDVYIDNHKGNFSLKLSHGKLKANDLTGNTKIELKFGDGIVNELDNSKLDVYYSDFQINKANQLNIDSKSSDFTIKYVNILKVNSRRDEFHIDQLDNFYGLASFSDFWIYKLMQESNVAFKYGNLTIDYIPKTFSFLKIDPNYTNVVMIFENGSSYLFDMIHKNVNFVYPQAIAKLDQKINPNDIKGFVTTGSFGSPKTNPSRLHINAINCSLSIIHK